MIRHIDSLRGKPKREGTWRVLSHAEAARVRHVHASAHKVTSIDRTHPQEYTRILLAAKDGDLPPGEADRRISKLGGKVRTRPLPRPPE